MCYGIVPSLCDAVEKEYLRDIEKLIGKKIPVIGDHEFPLQDNNPPQPAKQQSNQSQKRRGASNGYRKRKKSKNSSKRVRRPQ